MYIFLRSRNIRATLSTGLLRITGRIKSRGKHRADTDVPSALASIVAAAASPQAYRWGTLLWEKELKMTGDPDTDGSFVLSFAMWSCFFAASASIITFVGWVTGLVDPDIAQPTFATCLSLMITTILIVKTIRQKD